MIPTLSASLLYLNEFNVSFFQKFFFVVMNGASREPLNMHIECVKLSFLITD